MAELGFPVTEILYPEMRESVVRALRAFADPEYQQRVWIDRRFPHEGFYDDLDLNISILYDDCVVLPDPRTRIGTVLIDGAEIGRLADLDGVLDPLIRRLGDVPDRRYVEDAAWPRVVEAARAALVAMTGDERDARRHEP